MKYMKTIIAAFLLFTSTYSSAAQQLVVATEVWEGYSHEDGSGYYIDLLKAIYEPKGISISVKYVPYARSIDMVNTGKADLMLGAYKGEKVEGVFSDYAIENDVVDAAVSPALAATWQGVDSLAGKKVGAVNGYAFDDSVAVKMQYNEVSNLKSLIKMLNHGRIDAVLDYEADINAALQETGEKANFEIKNAVIITPSYAVFSNNERGKAMLKIFNEGMLELHNNGELKQLMMKNINNLDNFPAAP